MNVNNFSQNALLEVFRRLRRESYDSDFEEAGSFAAYDIATKINSLEKQLAQAQAEKAELVLQCAGMAVKYECRELEAEILSLLPKE